MNRHSDVAIKVKGLGKKYRIGQNRSHDTLRDSIMSRVSNVFGRASSGINEESGGSEEFWALNDVSFEIAPGEIVGIIGRNGAGKSTLLKTLARITEPSTGRIDVYGRVGSLLEVGTGFHQELSGRENVYLSGSILGMKKAEIDRHFDEIVDFSEVEKFIDTPVKHYSSGMYLRLAFGVAAFLQPEILLIDEVLAVGDAIFQKKCLGKMGDVAKQGRTVLFVSHNMSAVQELCNRGLLIQSGRVAFDGRAMDCVTEYYSQTNSYAAAERDTGKPLQVSALKVNDSLKPMVESGDSFIVSLEMAGREMRNPRVFLIIENVMGQTMLHSRVFSKDFGLDIIDGRYKLQVEVPSLWLSPGVYSMHFKFLVPTLEGEGRVQSERVMLEVHGEMENTGKAVLHPKVAWRYESLQ